MKRPLVLAAAALFVMLGVPASAQSYFWGVPGSVADIDDAAVNTYDTDGPTLKFKSSVAGTIVARYPVFSPVQDPGWDTLAVNYTGSGIEVKLIALLHCQKFTDEIASTTLPSGESNSCEPLSIPSGTWDFSQYSYYVEVTLTRGSTATDPQVHQLHFQ